MEKPVAVKFVLIWLTGNLGSEIQGYQMTHAFVKPKILYREPYIISLVEPELKLVARVTTESF